MNEKQVAEMLQRYFGYSVFRAGQWDIIRHALAGENVLGVLATGGGKSVCYQLPALMLPGLAVVISPLISLMVDQVRQLRQRGVRSAEYINSALSQQEQAWKMRQVANGQIKILYASPEKLQQESFVRELAGVGVSLFVVDEAHCISQWGHDFRTDYQRLGERIARLGHPPVLALTATATEAVQRDICTQLAIPPECVQMQSVNRENICYDVARLDNEQDKNELMFAKLAELQGPGLVYFRSRSGTERAFARAQERGIERCAFYHGGMAADDRMLVQQQFLDGELTIVFATNAFGMGIDKSDIRFVLHYHMPPDMESYLQETGRVGRDGRPGYACLLSVPEDGLLPHQLIHEEYPDEVQMRDWTAALVSHAGQEIELKKTDMQMKYGLSEQQVQILLYHLETLGGVSRVQRSRDGWMLVVSQTVPTNCQRLSAAIARRRGERYGKVEEMRRFLHEAGCRREKIGRYFAQEHHTALASCCDRCGIDMQTYRKQEESVDQRDALEWNWQKELDWLLPVEGDAPHGCT
ncbi:ATP-dependent DNA helicase RecQ [Aneurinibacillus soli]|uniref:ATP-dependent DNA helicase RecQ n=1 Tax=Aneurinibacillus soli TaxID=1500254 RepID=A0A0U5BBC7_9BACL|nr:ATP-dependent DNA helicase RecQ [Aneurinibacillus soli]PYE63007.1 ATP-dependent DNA helicase RecQ [Aneurinibacillus soli]BAU28934.1 ATP-dependent DNA helicase RecQ [Aneurinibacillus soli]